MERIVIACYKPKEGKEKDLLLLMKTHVPKLQEIGLASTRKPIIMKASDGTILEVFGWKSEEAIKLAHSHPVVLQMWQTFEATCDYEKVLNIKELSDLFPEFDAVN